MVIGRTLTISLLCMWALVQTTVAAEAVQPQVPAWAEVERIGPPNQNFIDVERYRFGRTDVSNPAFLSDPTGSCHA